MLSASSSLYFTRRFARKILLSEVFVQHFALLPQMHARKQHLVFLLLLLPVVFCIINVAVDFKSGKVYAKTSFHFFGNFFITVEKFFISASKLQKSWYIKSSY